MNNGTDCSRIDLGRNILSDGLTDGFKIIDNDADLTPFMMLNYKSATGANVKEKVEKQIITALEIGNYVVTNEPPTLISALGAIPKPDSDEIRLIAPTDRKLFKLT